MSTRAVGWVAAKSRADWGGLIKKMFAEAPGSRPSRLALRRVLMNPFRGAALQGVTPLSLSVSVRAASAIAASFGVAYADGLSVMERPRPDFDAKGVPLGAFRLFPTLDLGLTASDNVFQSGGAEKSDVAFNVKPAFKLTSEWVQHLLEFGGSLNSHAYAEYDSEDVTDWSLSADGRLDVQRGSAVFAGLSDSKQHEGRSSPNSPGNIKTPVGYSTFHAYGDVVMQPGDLGVSFGGDLYQFEYESTPLNGGGVLDNKDRNRDELLLRARVSYEFSPGYRAFFGATYNNRDFDRAIDRTGVNRDSDGHRLDVGVEFVLAHSLKGEAFAGHLEQHFGLPLSDFSGFDYGATLHWAATPLTTLHLSASRVLSDTTVAGASVSVDNSIGVGLDHELRRNVILQAGVSYVDSEFVGTSRDDEYVEGHVGAIYMIDRNMSVTAGYDHRQRSSSAPNEEFSEDRFHVDLRFQL